MRRTFFILALMAAGAAWADPPPAIPLTVTDGTHTVPSTKTLTVSGGAVSGSAGHATITVSGGGASLAVSDGTHNVTSTTSMTFSGATVGGSAGAATVTIAPSTALPVGPVFGTTGAFSRPALSSFTVFPPSDYYTDISGGPIALTFTGGPGDNWSYITVPVTGAFTATALIEPSLAGAYGEASTYPRNGIMMADAGGKFLVWGLDPTDGGPLPGFYLTGWSDHFSYAATYGNPLISAAHGAFWVRLNYDCTNITAAISTNNIHWDNLSVTPLARTSTILGAPVAVGWGSDAYGSSSLTTISSYLWHFVVTAGASCS